MYIPPVRGSSGGPGGNPLDPDTILANHYEIKALYQQEVIQLKQVIHGEGTAGPNMPFFRSKHTDDYFKMLKADGYSDDEAHAAATALFNKEFQESGGTPTDPVQQFETSLKNWDQDPQKSNVQRNFGEEILTRLTDATPPLHTEQDLQNFMTSFLKAPDAGSQRTVFFKFMGIQPQDIQSVLACGNLPNPINYGSLLDQACYKFYGQDSVHAGSICDQIAKKLQQYTDQMKTTSDKDAFVDFQKFVNTQVFGDPNWSSLSPTDQQHIEDLSGCMPPSRDIAGETDAIYNDAKIQPSFHNQFMGLQSMKDLGQYKADLDTYAKITDPKAKAAFWPKLKAEFQKVQGELNNLAGDVTNLLDKNAAEITKNLRIPNTDFSLIAQRIVGVKEASNVTLPPCPSDPTNKPYKDGAALFSYNNNSGKPDSQVFITVVGANPVTGVQCFVKYDPDGTPHYVDAGPGLDPKKYSYPLSYFNQSANGKPSFYLPQLGGGRIYTSIDKPLYFPVDVAHKAIVGIDTHNPSDPNYGTTWDKTEFTVDKSCVFLNPTAVDDFSLPLSVQETGTDGKSQESGRANASRAAIFDKMQSTLTKAGPPWTNLIYTAPGTSASRIVSSMNGLPADFFTTVHPGQTTSWMDAFHAKFSKPGSLKIDCDGTIWVGQIDPKTNVITFNGTTNGIPSIPLQVTTLTLPTNAHAILGNDGGAWGFQSQLQADIARNLEGAIETNTLTDKVPISQSYIQGLGQAGKFYQPNPDPSMPQFIDYYSQVIHSFGNGYTFPYDDWLGQGGEVKIYSPEDNYAGGSFTLGPLA